MSKADTKNGMSKWRGFFICLMAVAVIVLAVALAGCSAYPMDIPDEIVYDDTTASRDNYPEPLFSYPEEEDYVLTPEDTASDDDNLEGICEDICYEELAIEDAYLDYTPPPSAVLMSITVPMGQDVVPGDFIQEIIYISPIKEIWFVDEPSIFTSGDQTIEIGLKDYSGNQAVYSTILTVLPNTTPPRIIGTQNILTQFGNPIIFRQGVSAEDAFGRPLDFFVDSSALNIHEQGTYTVIYYTIDAWGLRTEVTIYVEVLEVDPERVREMASDILDEILHDGMTQVEQARAIYMWVNGNITFASNVSRRTLYESAYQAIRNRRGNCFVFYAISEVLLTQAGIPNMRVQRIEGLLTMHYWNLINPDGLGWHHFDTTTLRPIYGEHLDRFMFTASQAREFTELIRSYIGRYYHFTYDPELYPEIVQ